MNAEPMMAGCPVTDDVADAPAIYEAVLDGRGAAEEIAAWRKAHPGLR